MKAIVLTNTVVKVILLTAAAVCAFACMAWAQDVGTDAPVDTSASANDTSVNNDALADADTSAGAGIANDTTAAAPAAAAKNVDGNFGNLDDDDDDDDLNLTAADSANAPEQFRKPNLISREYEYRRQTRLAIVMMAFIVLFMATSQSWNPR